MEERPDIILSIGDLADMPSLSDYDRGKKSFEGRRFNKDVKATIDAQEKLFSPLVRHNKKANKSRKYTPRKIHTNGNHEDRIDRVANLHPELYGTIDMDCLKLQEFGWEVIPFKESINIHGINFSHYFTSGVKGAAISGANIARSLINNTHASCVQGHSHVYSHAEHSKPDGSKIFGLSVGCYSHPDMVEGWNKNTHHMWWRGVVILDGVGRWDGYYEEIRSITQSKIMDKYL